jgi:hypothetical protein
MTRYLTFRRDSVWLRFIDARKIRVSLMRRQSGEVRVPAKSTVYGMLDRHGLV